MSVDLSSNTCELTLRAEGAFNYDPLYFQGIEPNLITNPSFTSNLNGWTQAKGSWTRDAAIGNTNVGAVRVTADGTQKILQITTPLNILIRDRVAFSTAVYWEGASSDAKSTPIRIKAQALDSSGNVVAEPIFNAILPNDGDADGWVTLSGSWKNTNTSITNLRIQLEVTSSMRLGDVWFDDVYVSKYQLPF